MPRHARAAPRIPPQIPPPAPAGTRRFCPFSVVRVLFPHFTCSQGLGVVFRRGPFVRVDPRRVARLPAAPDRARLCLCLCGRGFPGESPVKVRCAPALPSAPVFIYLLWFRDGTSHLTSNC